MPSPGVRGRKALRFLHCCQNTQSVHWLWAFWHLQARLKGPSVAQVEFRVQLQHKSTYQQMLPTYLPVELVPKPPVGVLSFLFLLPDGWVAVLDDNGLPAISQATHVLSEIRYQNLHQESTPATPTHVTLSTTCPQQRLRVCVCVCVCNLYLM